MWFVTGRGILMRLMSRNGKSFLHKQQNFDLGEKAATTLKKHPELIPICCIVTIPLTLAVYSLFHAVASKGDVRIDKCKRNKLGPHEEIGPTQITKLYVRDPTVYRPIRELEVIKRDLKQEKEQVSPCGH